MKHKITFILVLIISLSLTLNTADNTGDSGKKDPMTIAQKYMTYLTSGDYGKLSNLYHRGASFDDFTAEQAAQGGYHYRGKTDILDFWTKYSKGRISYKFTSSKQFVSGDYVVMIGIYEYKGTGEAVGLSKEMIINIKVSAVTTLKVVDGLVISHLDMVDYKSMLNQISQQKAAFDKKKK